MSIFMSSGGGLDRSRLPAGPLTSTPSRPVRVAREPSRVSDDAYMDAEEPVRLNDDSAPETHGSEESSILNGIVLAVVNAIEESAIFQWMKQQIGKETAKSRYEDRMAVYDDDDLGLDTLDEDDLDDADSLDDMEDDEDYPDSWTEDEDEEAE